MHYLIRNNRIAKEVDSKRVRGKAAREAYDFIKKAMPVEESAARQYIRYYERFGGNAEAIRVFNVGELNILAAKKNTDAQIEEIIAVKNADPKMKRDDLRKLIKTIRQRDEELADAQAQRENVTSLLQDATRPGDVCHLALSVGTEKRRKCPRSAHRHQ